MSASDGLARSWRCGDVTLDLARTRVMGVVNVTPDSFSDGGLHAGAEAAIAWGERLLDDGADILDVGGESTRPGFTPVDPKEECRRVLPVIEALAARGATVSVDTRHAEVARAALDAGACIVNDVSGFRDPAMVRVMAEHGSCGCVCMHSGGGHLGAGDADVAAGGLGIADEVEAFLLAQARVLERAGVARERIALDCGPGFGKTAAQDVELQRATHRFAMLGYPYLCAPSRKRFVGVVSGVTAAAGRDAATAGVCLASAQAGARVVRVHDVALVAQALMGAEAASAGPVRQALVALGSNMGDRLETMRSALSALDALPMTRVTAVSHAYDTAPAYLDDQPAFANAVARLSTGLHPLALLQALLGVEADHKRVRTVANGPRTLDLDLLWMEGERHAGARLTLPHPLMGERSFVLTPLADVLPAALTVEAFAAGAGIALAPEDARVGEVTADLGVLWERGAR